MQFIKTKKFLFLYVYFLYNLAFLNNTKAAPHAGGGAGPTNTASGPCTEEQLDTVFGCINKGSNSGISANTVLPEFVVRLFNWTIGAIATFAMIGLIYAGYTYVTSAGNPDKIKLAKDIIITSLTGIILVIFSFALFKFFGLA